MSRAGILRRAAAAAFAMSMAGSAASAANILVNPDFESGTLAPWYTARDFDPAKADWTVNDDDAHSGDYSAVAEGNKEIRQDFLAVDGATITQISFWLRHPTEPVSATFATLFYSDGSFDEQLYNGDATTDWQFFDITDLLDTSMSVVGLGVWGYSGGGAAADITRLDDFILDGVPGSGTYPDPGGDPVPEPAAWALMIAGFGLAGARLRARRASAAA